MTLPTTTRAALAFAAALLLAPSARSANIFAVRRGTVKSLLGEKPESIAAALSKLDEKQAQPFAGDTTLKGTALFSSEGFSIVIFRIGEGVASPKDPGDVGGMLTFQLRDAPKNVDGAHAPLIFTYDMNPKTPPPKAKPRGEPTGVEEDAARAPRSRVQSLVPEYNGFASRQPKPQAEFFPLPNGWCVIFSFSWTSFLGHLPFEEGKYPVSWRLVADYAGANGATATWGALDDPVLLSWGRPGDKFADELREAAFMSKSLGPAAKERSTYYDTRWTTHRTERLIGYFDAGKPTFEPKNPDSDELFYVNCAQPVISANNNMLDALYFNLRDGPQKPKVLTMQKSFQVEIFSKLDRLLFLAHELEGLRRDYLLQRFAGKPMPAPSDASAKSQKKAASKTSAGAPDGDGLDAVAPVEAGIELDDISF